MIISLFAAALFLPSAGGDLTVVRSDAVCLAEAHQTVQVRDGQIAYRDLGPITGRPVLLISGTDQQMTQWPASLIEGLKAKGLRPIVYDARDVGCSTHHTSAGPVDWPAVFTAMSTGAPPPLAYDLTTMAQDGLAVLDALHVQQAILVGASGGATVAGEIAAAQPARVQRLVLLMANSGDPAIPFPADPARVAPLSVQPPASAAAADVIAYRIAASTTLAGSAAGISTEERAAMTQAATARSWDPDGIARSGAALLVAGDRRKRLGGITAPTLVIHGAEDPLVSAASGQSVQQSIPNARYVLVPGMGHELSPPAVAAVLSDLAAEPVRNDD